MSTVANSCAQDCLTGFEFYSRPFLIAGITSIALVALTGSFSIASTCVLGAALIGTVVSIPCTLFASKFIVDRPGQRVILRGALDCAAGTVALLVGLTNFLPAAITAAATALLFLIPAALAALAVGNIIAKQNLAKFGVWQGVVEHPAEESPSDRAICHTIAGDTTSLSITFYELCRYHAEPVNEIPNIMLNQLTDLTLCGNICNTPKINTAIPENWFDKLKTLEIDSCKFNQIIPIKNDLERLTLKDAEIKGLQPSKNNNLKTLHIYTDKRTRYAIDIRDFPKLKGMRVSEGKVTVTNVDDDNWETSIDNGITIYSRILLPQAHKQMRGRPLKSLVWCH